MISHNLVCKYWAIMVLFWNGEVYFSKWLLYKSKFNIFMMTLSNVVYLLVYCLYHVKGCFTKRKQYLNGKIL